jgi:hypothetical protein
VWGRDDDGALFGITYKRDTLTTSQPPTFYAAWHRHTLGSGRSVESICSGPSVGGDLDSLTMVTTIRDTGVRHVEVLTDTPDERRACRRLVPRQCGHRRPRPATTTPSRRRAVWRPDLNGLWHLNGKTVQVFAGGLDCGDRGTGGDRLLHRLCRGQRIDASFRSAMASTRVRARAVHAGLRVATKPADRRRLHLQQRRPAGAPDRARRTPARATARRSARPGATISIPRWSRTRSASRSVARSPTCPAQFRKATATRSPLTRSPACITTR